MDNRYMKMLSQILLLSLTLALTAQEKEVLPTESHLKWADLEIGVLIHYDINVFAKGGYVNVDYARKETLPDLSVFNPSKLNTDQWIQAAKNAGAKYAVLVAKHGTGFTLWPSGANDYHIGNTPFRDGKGDIVKDFIQSCKKFGLQPGIYYNTNYNAYYGAGYTKLPEEEILKYNKIVYNQLFELWTQYGSLFEIWFDGGVMTDKKTGIGERVSVMLRKYQSEAILFQGPLQEKNLIRWVGNEEGTAPYPNWSRSDAVTSSDGTVKIPDLRGNPDGEYWIPGEADFPNRKGEWMWKPDMKNNPVYSADELMHNYYTSAGRNANMLIGMVIDTAGLFPEEDSKVFEEFGRKLKERSETLAGERKGKGNTVILNFKSSTQINQIEIQEDISKGEHIRSYYVEGLADGNWIRLCEGTSVGHKRIQLFDPVNVSSVRLTVENSSGIPAIRRFAAYNF